MTTVKTRVMVLILGASGFLGCAPRGPEPTAQVASPCQALSAPAPVPVPAAPVVATPAAPAVTPPPATPVRQTTLSEDDRLAVKRLVIARSVKNREPVNPGVTFKGDRVYAFVEVENRAHAPGEIVVEFEPPGGGPAHGDVTLAVGPAARWRTWAYTRTASIAGSWTAVVKNRRGDVLARAPFEVTL